MGSAINHYPRNGLGHLWIVEHPIVHIISLQHVIHYYTCEDWFIATEPQDRIPTMITIAPWAPPSNCKYICRDFTQRIYM